MDDTFGLKLLTAELNVDEGYERLPYIDSRGNLSGGRGRNLGKGFSDSEIELMFANDVAGCCEAMDRFIPWWRTLPPAKQRVMINLCFNLGWNSLAGFTHFLAAMRSGNWAVAADELKDSRWWGQVGERGPRVVARLLAPDGAPMA